MTWTFLGWWIGSSLACAGIWWLAHRAMAAIAQMSQPTDRLGRSLTEAQQRQVFDAVVRGR